ncbi:hypothetical protein MD484_g9039, partial [Candolleomyces efflorescens]
MTSLPAPALSMNHLTGHSGRFSLPPPAVAPFPDTFQRLMDSLFEGLLISPNEGG